MSRSQCMLLLCLLPVVLGNTRARALHERFNDEVHGRLFPKQERAASVLGFGEGCQPLVGKCTGALVQAPAGVSPDPAELGPDSAKCAFELCNCAGPPAAYDPALQACNVGNKPLTSATVNSTATHYPHATCKQVEGCINAPCDINAWKKYTTGLPECDTMWHCMKQQLQTSLATCSEHVTTDSNGAVCNQDPICAEKQKTYAVMPAGKVDCKWEYSKVQSDAASVQKIENKCASLACSCMRRGTVGTCNGKTSCCINGNSWDTHVVNAEGVATYDVMDCEEVDVCLSAVTYCHLVQEPESLMPAECKGYAHNLYTDKVTVHTSCTSSLPIFTRDGECTNAAGNACELVEAATQARCDTIPHMYQTCRPGTEVHAVSGVCVCSSVNQHSTQCSATSGNCIHTPLPTSPCTTDANCSGHATEVDAVDGKCQCTCTADWVGAACDSKEAASFPVYLIVIIAGGSFVFCGVAVGLAVWYVMKESRGEVGLNQQLLEMKEKDIELEMPATNPSSTASLQSMKTMKTDATGSSTFVTPAPTLASAPTSVNPTPVLLPTASPATSAAAPVMLVSAPITNTSVPLVTAITAPLPTPVSTPEPVPIMIPRSEPRTPPEAHQVQVHQAQMKTMDWSQPQGNIQRHRRSSTISMASPTPSMTSRRNSQSMRRTPSPALSAALSIATSEQRARREEKKKRRSSSKHSATRSYTVNKRRSQTPPPRSKLDDADITAALAELSKGIGKSRRSRSKSTVTVPFFTEKSFKPVSPPRRAPPPSFAVNKLTL